MARPLLLWKEPGVQLAHPDRAVHAVSGICGLVSFGVGEADTSALVRMTEVLKRRGPEGTNHWHGGPAMLGHTLLATTFEAEKEQLPLEDPVSGCVITADARLDNREELSQKLGLVDDIDTVGDGELILRAYQEWSFECPKLLLGDFAFAIWDPQRFVLFAARDQLGMRQITYCADDRACALATDPQALVALDPDRFPINKARIADFFEDAEGRDQTSTFFLGITRLPPAHCLIFDASGIKIEKYWTLQPTAELKLPSNEAYAEAFLKVFTEAVRCRLRSNGPVGAMLSGGVDSSSVAAVAAELLAKEQKGPLRTFSGVGPDPAECNETKAIHQALVIPGIEARLVNYADLCDLQSELIEQMDMVDDPFDSNMNIIRAAYACARRSNIKVVLDGAAADVVLTPGDTLQHFIKTGQGAAAVRQARGAREFWGRQAASPWTALAAAAWRTFVPQEIRGGRRTLLNRLARPHRVSESDVEAAISEYVKLYASKRGLERERPIPPSPAESRACAILHPNLTVGRERYERVASHYCIEARDPFMDLRLIAFCLSLPADQVQADGWPKIIMRRALKAYLPDEVRWRRGKEHLGWCFTQSMFDNCARWRGANLEVLKKVGMPLRTIRKAGREIRLCDRISAPAAKLLWLTRWLDGISKPRGPGR